VTVTYPVFDPSGTNFLGTYDNVDSFLDLAVDPVADVSVPALHQSPGPSHPTARVYQRF
jgi:hypothetical protein